MNDMYDVLRAQRSPMEQLIQQRQSIDQTKFKQIVPSLNSNILSQLVAQARSQGISDSDIQAGLEFIKQLK